MSKFSANYFEKYGAQHCLIRLYFKNTWFRKMSRSELFEVLFQNDCSVDIIYICARASTLFEAYNALAFAFQLRNCENCCPSNIF